MEDIKETEFIRVSVVNWLQRIEDQVKEVRQEIARSNALLEAQGNRITAVETKVNTAPVIASAIGGGVAIVASLIASVLGFFKPGSGG